MGSIDSTTWQALGLTLTLVGVLLSLLLWRRRGPAPGLRGLAWSLLPAAAGLTGTLKLLWDLGDSIVRWATRLVFSPVVWAGIVLFGCSLLLFAVTAAMRARGVGRRPSGREALPRERSAPAAAPTARSARGARTAPAADDGMDDDIEAILRKHGIS